MKRRGLETVEIATIRLPHDMRERRRKPHVRKLAESIGRVGLLQPPLLRLVDNGLSLICGADRIAACLESGLRTADCTVFECDDEEAALILADENLQRRHLSVNERLSLEEDVKALEFEREKRRIVEENSDRMLMVGPPAEGDFSPRKRGANLVPRDGVWNNLAKRHGISRATMVRWQYRRSKESAETDDTAYAYIETFGFDVPNYTLARIDGARRYFARAIRAIGKVRGELTQLVESATPSQDDELAKVVKKAVEVEAKLRELAPVAVCPACKAVEEISPDCKHCDGAGYAGKRKVQTAPKRLTNKNTPYVVFGRRAIKWETYLAIPMEDE